MEYHWYQAFFICQILFSPADALHLKGTWHSENFFEFLGKFGFQQTKMQDLTNTQGYIYGNITSRNNVTNDLTLVVVDSEYFLDFYANRSVLPRKQACSHMFKKIEQIAWDPVCDVPTKDTEDFLRHIPCRENELCVDEDTAEWVLPGYQFTFRIRDTIQPRFWYVSIVSCYHDSTNRSSCEWTHDPDQNIAIDYDIWLVNGHPFNKHVNPFEHQFSFDLHDIFEVYLAFFIIYSFLMPIQIYALTRQKHSLPLLLTVCMCMEYVGVTFNFIHNFKFIFDGSGVELLKVTGNFIDTIAQCLFMLLLLLIVKGWTITRMDLTPRSKGLLFTVWGTYTLANMALFVWNQMEIDFISDIDEWQTWPGRLILIFRLLIMAWFLYELRETLSLEFSPEKNRFYLHFGAGFLVWFVYLPIVALIGMQVSALWRYKTILSVSYAADFLSFCVMVHLLWPSRSYLYFNLKVETRIPLEDIQFAELIGNSSDENYEEETSNILFKKPSEGSISNPDELYTTINSSKLEDNQTIYDQSNHLSMNGSQHTGDLVEFDSDDCNVHDALLGKGHRDSATRTLSMENLYIAS